MSTLRNTESAAPAIAKRVVAAADLDDVCAKVEISGPGFINLPFADPLLGQLLALAAEGPPTSNQR